MKVYHQTGTLWEDYAPEAAERGSLARPAFVGWTGLVPIAVLFEYVFGIQADEKHNKIVWEVNLTERHGIQNYPFGGADVDLLCEARTEEERPNITVRSSSPVTVEVHWKDEIFTVKSF